MKKTHRALLWAASAGALLVVFMAYQRPDIAFTLANQLWACF